MTLEELYVAHQLAREYAAWRQTRGEPGTLRKMAPALAAFVELARAEDIELTRRGEPLVTISEPVMIAPVVEIWGRMEIDDDAPMMRLARSFPQEWYEQPDWQPMRLVRLEDGTYGFEDRNRLTVEAIQKREALPEAGAGHDT